MKQLRIGFRRIIAVALFAAVLFGTCFTGNTVRAEENPNVPRYTITYNANGGENVPETQYKYKDQTLILSTQVPYREGYEFIGWSTTVYPGVLYQPGDEYTANRGAKFYANWRVSEFTISYNANGGEGAPENQKKKRGIPLTLSSQIPYREGYTFLGWSTTTEPNVRYQPGAEYTNDYGAKLYAIWKQNDDPSGFYKVTFSGIREESVSTTRYCYAEGERVVLLLDKGLLLPGDTLQSIEQIMGALEGKTGLSYDVSFPRTAAVDRECKRTLGFNPWEGIEYGQKVVVLLVDSGDSVFSSYESDGEMILVAASSFYDVFNNPLFMEGYLSSYYDYIDFAHELTHILTERYSDMSWNVTEGSAEYLSGYIMEELSGESEDYAKSFLCYQKSIVDPDIAITTENVEELFVTDCYGYLPDWYCYGRELCKFLDETYGSAFLKDYVCALKESGLNAAYGYFTDYEYEVFTALFKETFGDDIFIRFGNWYQEQLTQ